MSGFVVLMCMIILCDYTISHAATMINAHSMIIYESHRHMYMREFYQNTPALIRPLTRDIATTVHGPVYFGPASGYVLAGPYMYSPYTPQAAIYSNQYIIATQ